MSVQYSDRLRAARNLKFEQPTPDQLNGEYVPNLPIPGATVIGGSAPKRNLHQPLASRPGVMLLPDPAAPAPKQEDGPILIDPKTGFTEENWRPAPVTRRPDPPATAPDNKLVLRGPDGTNIISDPGEEKLPPIALPDPADSLPPFRPKPVEKKPPVPATDMRQAQEQKNRSLRADPKRVKRESESALRGRVQPFDAAADLGDREETQRLAQDTEEFKRAEQAWTAEHFRLKSQYDQALDSGNDAQAQAAAEAIQAHNARRPQPTTRMTGGLTPQELEESVNSTHNRFADEDPESADILIQHFIKSYGEKWEDDFNGTYADLPPDERLRTMEADAARLKNNQSSFPTVARSDRPDGYEPRRAGQPRQIGATPEQAGVPLTERRLPDEDGDRVPMMPGRGSKTEVGGTLRPAAPDGGVMSLVTEGKFTSNPPVLEGEGATGQSLKDWEEAMIAVAVASGVDVNAFENRGDLVRKGQNILKDHEKRTGGGANAKSKIVHNPQGRRYYAPTEQAKRDAHLAGQRADFREFTNNYPTDPNFRPGLAPGDEGYVDPQGHLTVMRAALDKAKNAKTQEQYDAAMQEYRDEKARIRSARQAGTAAAARQQLMDRGMVQNMNNPNVAPAMLRRSLQQAGSLEEQANVLLQFGMFKEADQLLGRSNERAASQRKGEVIDANIENIKSETEANNRKDATPDATASQNANMAMRNNAVNAAFDPDTTPEAAFQLWKQHAVAQHAATGGTTKPPTDEEMRYSFAREIYTKSGGKIDNINVQIALQQALKNIGTWWRSPQQAAEAFGDYVKEKIGIDPTIAGRWYTNHNKPAD
jgi:hypothetical protein